MALTALVYASKSRIAPAAAQREFAELVAMARRANSETGITGALITKALLFNHTHFVQVIEGSEASV